MALNYIGSKLSLLNFIHFIVNREIKEDIFIVGDLFAGTGVVGQSFKKKGYKIIANDIQYYSFVLNKKYLTNNDFVRFEGLVDVIPNLSVYEKKERILHVLDYLNNLKERKKGFIFDNYSLGGTRGKEFERMYFSDENALKIDTIRLKIEEWFRNKKISEKEYFY
jgi:adenine-specific DNA-methyltransferase